MPSETRRKIGVERCFTVFLEGLVLVERFGGSQGVLDRVAVHASPSVL
jgi:hypothetical protein